MTQRRLQSAILVMKIRELGVCTTAFGPLLTMDYSKDAAIYLFPLVHGTPNAACRTLVRPD
jgi:hypothetical protein